MIVEKLRCLFGKDDDLHQFAERFLRDASFFTMVAAGKDMLNLGDASVCKLHTDGMFQVELVTVRGGYYIPPHTHPHMDAIEVNVSGAVRFVVNGNDVFKETSDERLLQRTRMRGLRIGRHDNHHGWVLPCGAVFLSLQKWHKAPTSVGLDYEGIYLNDEHKILLTQGL
jgi:hypothetical protein